MNLKALINSANVFLMTLCLSIDLRQHILLYVSFDPLRPRCIHNSEMGRCVWDKTTTLIVLVPHGIFKSLHDYR